MRIVRDHQVAEDLAQETYIRTKAVLDVRPVDHLESYMFQTARNLALDHQRKQKFRGLFEESHYNREIVENIASGAVSADEELIERERQRVFEQVLSTLPQRARKAWALAQIEGWSYQEIADHLNVSRNTVYNDIKMVMGHCRDALARLERG